MGNDEEGKRPKMGYFFEEKRSSSEQDSRRSPRFRLYPLHQVSFFSQEHGLKFSVFNMSIGGMGFSSDSLTDWKGDMLQGELTLNQKTLPIKLKIIHRTGEVVGCSFVSPPTELRDEIETYFRIEIESSSVTRIESKSQPLRGEKVVLFKGESNCEIFLREENNEFVSFSILFFGNYLDGNGDEISASVIDPSAGSANGVSIFRIEQGVDKSLLEGCLRFINAVGVLTERERTYLVKSLEKRLKT